MSAGGRRPRCHCPLRGTCSPAGLRCHVGPGRAARGTCWQLVPAPSLGAGSLSSSPLPHLSSWGHCCLLTSLHPLQRAQQPGAAPACASPPPARGIPGLRWCRAWGRNCPLGPCTAPGLPGSLQAGCFTVFRRLVIRGRRCWYQHARQSRVACGDTQADRRLGS